MAEVSAETLAKIAEAVAVATAKSIQEHEVKQRPFEVPLVKGKSVFNPRAEEPGYKKPALTRETIFCSNREEESRLTPKEIELYNKITRPGRYHNRRWEVIVTQPEDGSRGTLDIRIPCRELNDRMEMPSSLPAILREIIEEQTQREAQANAPLKK